MMMKNFRISDFCHFVDVGEKVKAVYNSLTLGVLFLQEEIAGILEKAIGGILEAQPNLTDNLLNALIKNRIIFPLGERSDLEDYINVNKLLNNEGVSVLYLLATDGCNLGCSYCYIKNALPEGYSFSMMDKNIAEKALQLYVANISKFIEEPKIVLYGGEPLLNMDVVFYVANRYTEMKLLGQLPEKTSLTINTNATLINEEFLYFIRNKNITIAVSLDGMKEMHDCMRKYRDGGGTYDQVTRNCFLMAERGINFGLSVTVTKANINDLENVLCWLHDKFGVLSIGFNIAIHQNEEVLGMAEEKYAELITQKLINCFKICREKGIYEDRMMRKVDAFVKGYPYIYDCGAPGDQFVVSPEGLVGICQAYCGNKKYFVPIDEIKNAKDHPIWKKWKSRSPIYQKQCYSCISLGICGGGCPYNAELKTGSIWGIDETFCVHSKKTVRFLLEDLYQQTKQN